MSWNNDDRRVTFNIKNIKVQNECSSQVWIFGYSDAYIFIKETITVLRQSAIEAGRNNKQVIFKDLASFTNCISETNNTQIDNP